MPRKNWKKLKVVNLFQSEEVLKIVLHMPEVGDRRRQGTRLLSEIIWLTFFVNSVKTFEY